MTLSSTDEAINFMSGFKKNRHYTRDFIKWVLNSYKLGTINGYIQNKWTPSATYQWGVSYGMPNTLLELIQKDILIARLCGKVSQDDCKTLDELFEDYQELGSNKKPN